MEDAPSLKPVVKNKKKKSLGDPIARKSCGQVIPKQFPSIPIRPNTRSTRCPSM